MIKFSEKTRQIFFYEAFGPSWAGMVGASDLIDVLDQLGPGKVNIRINSIGGTVDEALAMLTLLKRHEGGVAVSIDSLAASAASFFMPKEFQVTAAKYARIMIHHPRGLTYGDVAAHQKAIDALSVYGKAMETVYERLNKTPDEVSSLLEAETWYTAEQALEAGLIDAIDDKAEKVKPATVPDGMFRNTPQDLLSINQNPITARNYALEAKLKQIRAEFKL